MNDKKYDLIVCNPPFFEDSLKSNNDKRNIARHNISLTYEELISSVGQLLSDDGIFSTIIPAESFDRFMELASKENLFLLTKINVYPTPSSKIKRYILEFSKAQQCVREEDIVIELSRHKYSDKYKALTKDFYL